MIYVVGAFSVIVKYSRTFVVLSSVQCPEETPKLLYIGCCICVLVVVVVVGVKAGGWSGQLGCGCDYVMRVVLAATIHYTDTSFTEVDINPSHFCPQPT